MPQRGIFGCGDNSFGQLGNFVKMEYADPLRIKTSYTEIATFNGISLGKSEVNGIPVFDAWGLFKFEESRKEDHAELKRIAKIITRPKPVRCQSFNDFIERYSCLTYSTVTRVMSPTLMRGEDSIVNEPELINDKELLEVQYLFGDERPVEGAVSVHIGDKNKFSVLDGCCISPNANINVADVQQTADNQGYNQDANRRV